MEPLQEVSQHLLTAALKFSSELTSVPVLLPAEHTHTHMGTHSLVNSYESMFMSVCIPEQKTWM